MRPSPSAIVLVTMLAANLAFARVSEVPSNPSAMTDVQRAAILVEERDFARARELMEPWVVSAPDDAEAWSILGFARRKTGDPDKAMEAYERALALEPMHKGANEYLGTFWLELGRPDLARERLLVLERACPQGCEERDELADAIATWPTGDRK